MSNIVDLYKEFKSETEKKAFMQKQHETISQLMDKVKQLEEERDHLKSLLTSSVPLVTPVIVTPEEHLIDSQIEMIQARSLGQELSLEDLKKLDLLLKNKHALKSKDIKTTSKPVLSQDELLAIVSKP